jgi:hypothetical protein
MSVSREDSDPALLVAGDMVGQVLEGPGGLSGTSYRVMFGENTVWVRAEHLVLA